MVWKLTNISITLGNTILENKGHVHESERTLTITSKVGFSINFVHSKHSCWRCRCSSLQVEESI